MEQRQKQIDYGKNTTGYDNYLKAVPRPERTKEHPRTPDKSRKCSKRAWDGLIRVWRRQLHKYDQVGDGESEEEELTAETASMAFL